MTLLDRVIETIRKIEVLRDQATDLDKKEKMTQLLEVAKASIQIIQQKNVPCPAYLEPLITEALDSIDKTYTTQTKKTLN